MFEKLRCLILIGVVLGLGTQALGGVRTAEELLVDLRAEDLAYGEGATTWTNHGTLDDFTAVGTPVVEDVDGRKAVTFDEPSFFEGPLTPEGIYGGGTRTIEVWAYNGTDLVGEETLVSWSHRGGPDNTNIAFNYGNNTTWGAVGHWGAAGDMPWSAPHAPCPEPLNWWYLVYTFDGTTVRLYVNGEENTTRDIPLNTHGPNIIRVAAQANGAGDGVQSGLGFTGSIAAVRIHDGVLSPEDIAYNFVIGDLMAKNPRPVNEQSDVRRDIVLRWSPGDTAVAHDVYFGTDPDSVASASRTDPMGVLVSQGQTGVTYAPDGGLDLVATYYWRIDEVAADNTIYAGNVWSFTSEPYTYPITGIEATTNGVSDAGSEAIHAVDGSGLNDDGQHSTDVADMWLAVPPADEPMWLQCAFDKVYKLDEMQVWNHNTAFESFLGFGVKDVTIEYSVDGADWTTLGDYVLEGAPGTTTYTANTTVDLEGIAAQYVRLVTTSAYGAGNKIGLSEVRFMYTPVQARDPEPADGATNVDVEADLAWRPGRDVAQHDVYLDTTDGTTLVATTQTDGYEPGTLDLGTTYYWKVDEVNDAEAITAWEGLLWSFSTQEYVEVDDFETYIDDDAAGDAIWELWIDGLVQYGGDAANGGSQVGHTQTPFAEKEIVYSGTQSMPLYYDNTSSPYYSQAKRTFATPQNWAKAGITTLVIYFRGDFDNAADPIYAVINGTRVDYDGGAGIIALPMWKQWNIDLTGIPNLQSVTDLAIGVGGGSPGGTGILYVDAIRLYSEAPESPAPVDPGSDGLAAHYTFDGTLADASGNGNAATAMGNEIYEASGYGDGQALAFDGINDYVELPIGPVVASSDSMTIATRYNMLPNANNWQRLFDFGTSSTEGYMFLCPQQGTSGSLMRFAITETAGGAAESILDVPGSIMEGWHHVAVVIDGDAMTATIYLDGTSVATGAVETVPSDLGQTTQNWLGRSQYEADGYYNGLIDEFRIYTRPLSAGEIRYLAGER